MMAARGSRLRTMMGVEALGAELPWLRADLD
jgi:hypothetical protein